MKNLVVFSPHHDDAYWQASGVTLFMQRAGWRVTYITVIGDHYEWGGGKDVYRRRALEAAEKFGVEHILLDYKSMACSGENAEMAEAFCDLIKELQPTIAITEYPVAIHPDHKAVSINSLRALTIDWFGVPRKMPSEVWCYQGYNAYPLLDFSIDISSVQNEVRDRIVFWEEFGKGEGNSLWQNRVQSGMKESFFMAKADTRDFTIAKEILGEKLSFCSHRITKDLLF